MRAATVPAKIRRSRKAKGTTKARRRRKKSTAAAAIFPTPSALRKKKKASRGPFAFWCRERGHAVRRCRVWRSRSAEFRDRGFRSAAVERPADLPAQRGGGRHRYAHHARDSRRGSFVEHAEAGADLSRARREPPIFAHVPLILGSGPHAAFQAARRNQRGLVCRRRISARGIPQFSRAAGMVAGRRFGIYPHQRTDCSDFRWQESAARTRFSTGPSSSGSTRNICRRFRSRKFFPT